MPAPLALGRVLVGRDDRGERLAADLVALGDDHGLAVLDVGGRDAADELVLGLARGLEQRRLEELLGAAVLDPDDHVLRDVHQAAGQVARVRRTQRRVREALAGAVGGGEVLDHVEAFHEVRLHGPLDDLALRVGHQAAHAGQLADLLERATGAGAGHHVDGVQLVGLLDVLDHRVGDLVGRRVPLVGDRQVALLLRDQAVLVLLLQVARRAPRTWRGSAAWSAARPRRSWRS